MPFNFVTRYADRAKQIVCKAVVNEDPNAKVSVCVCEWVSEWVCVCVRVCVCERESASVGVYECVCTVYACKYSSMMYFQRRVLYLSRLCLLYIADKWANYNVQFDTAA